MVLIAIKNVKGRQNKFIFIVNQLLEQLNVVWVWEMVPCQTVHICHQLLFTFGHRWL